MFIYILSAVSARGKKTMQDVCAARWSDCFKSVWHLWIKFLRRWKTDDKQRSAGRTCLE